MRCMLVLLLLLSPAYAQQSGPDRVERDAGADHFAAGGHVIIGKPVQGDLVASGGEIRAAASVGGDGVLAGGNVSVDGGIGQDLYAAGGWVSLNASVQRNARVAGGKVELGRQARVTGNMTAAGGTVNLLGEVAGYLQAAGGRVYIDGSVAGDVDAAAGELQLGPNARIAGTLRYRSGGELVRDPAAEVLGGIEVLPVPARMPGAALARAASWIWTVGLMLLAAVLVLALPGVSARVSEALRARPGWSVLLGFILLVCMPAAVVLAFVTGIGAPLALLALLIYFALLLAGYAAAGIALGDAGLRRVRPTHATQPRWRALAALLAILAIGLAARIPFLGWILTLVALLAGIGALAYQAARGRAAAT